MPKLDANNSKKKYKVEAIQDNIVYTRELKGHLSAFYYLIV